MINNKDTYKPLFSALCSEGILLIYSFWCNIYYPAFVGYKLKFMLFLIIAFIIYIMLYYWCHLKISSASFLRFFIIFIQGILFIYALRICFYPLPLPIYMDDLPLLSQYRYLFLSIISLSAMAAFLVMYFFKPEWSLYLQTLSFPYLKEEMRLILYTWNPGFLGDFCSKIIDQLAASFLFRILFFSIHFTLFYLIQILMLFFLWSCIFYNLDFRFLFSFTPLFFIIWLLSFFYYYFLYFYGATSNYIKSLLIVTKTKKSPTFFGTQKFSSEDLSFELSSQALSKGFSTIDMPNLLNYLRNGIFKHYYRLIFLYIIG